MASIAEMSRIESIFKDLRAQGRKALMPFVVAGDPSLAQLVPSLLALQAGGASIAEIGIPFSDPIADGPVIAQAMHRALQQGVTPDAVMSAVKNARASLQMGLVAMVSVSIVQRCGGARFIEQLAEAGFDGVIVPDADLDSVRPLCATAEKRSMSFSMLIAPTTNDQRIERLCEHSRGFVYLLARAGITGESDQAPEVGELVRRVRKFTSLPLAVGFGISTAAHVKAVVRHADAAIVGSSLVKRLASGDHAQAYICELSAGLQYTKSE